MKKTFLINLFAILLMASAFQLYAQTDADRPVPAAAKTTAPAVSAPEKTESSASTQPAAADTKKAVQPRKFGPGVTKIPKSEATESLGISSTRMLFAMVVVIAAMGIFFWGLKKLNSKLNTFDKASSIRVKSRLQLDSKNSVVLVGVYEQEFLIGSGSNGVTLISKFSSIDDGAGLSEEEIPAEEPDDAKSDMKDVSFGEKLLSLGAPPVESSSLKKINGAK